MSRSWAGGSDRRWRAFRVMILARDGQVCQVPKGAGVCGAHATHVDHIVTLADGGAKYDPANARAACAPCNLSRGTLARAAGPTVPVTVVIGPPGGGKTTYVAHHAAPGDVVIDLDKIAVALTAGGDSEHVYPDHVRSIAIAARAAAIRRAVALQSDVGVAVWLVHSIPSEQQLRAYLDDHWTVVVCDPGADFVRARTVASDRQVRHLRAIDLWYAHAGRLRLILDTHTSVDPWKW